MALGFIDLSGAAEEAGSMFGTGIRRAAGWKSKEELIQEITSGADFSTPEGIEAAISKIREVDWETARELEEELYKAITDRKTAEAYSQSIDLQKQNLELEKEQFELDKIKRKNAPHIKSRYKLEEEVSDIQAFLTANLPEASGDEITNVTTTVQANALIAKYVDDSSLRTVYKNGLSNHILTKLEEYKGINLYNADFMNKDESKGNGTVSREEILNETGSGDAPLDENIGTTAALTEDRLNGDKPTGRAGIITPSKKVQVGTKDIRGKTIPVYETTPAVTVKNPNLQDTTGQKKPNRYSSLFTQ